MSSKQRRLRLSVVGGGGGVGSWGPPVSPYWLAKVLCRGSSARGVLTRVRILFDKGRGHSASFKFMFKLLRQPSPFSVCPSAPPEASGICHQHFWKEPIGRVQKKKEGKRKRSRKSESLTHGPGSLQISGVEPCKRSKGRSIPATQQPRNDHATPAIGLAPANTPTDAWSFARRTAEATSLFHFPGGSPDPRSRSARYGVYVFFILILFPFPGGSPKNLALLRPRPVL